MTILDSMGLLLGSNLFTVYLKGYWLHLWFSKETSGLLTLIVANRSIQCGPGQGEPLLLCLLCRIL